MSMQKVPLLQLLLLLFVHSSKATKNKLPRRRIGRYLSREVPEDMSDMSAGLLFLNPEPVSGAAPPWALSRSYLTPQGEWLLVTSHHLHHLLPTSAEGAWHGMTVITIEERETQASFAHPVDPWYWVSQQVRLCQGGLSRANRRGNQHRGRPDGWI